MPKLKPNHISPTNAEDAMINTQIAADPDDQELDDEWFSKAKSASEFFPPEVYAELVELQHRGGRPKMDTPKVSITLRVDQDMAEYWRAMGKGWQTRLQAVLAQYMADHPLSH